MDIPYTIEARPDTGTYNAKIGMWLFLASEVMLFGGLFSSYILLRVGAPPGTWPHGWLNVPLGTINTCLLSLSAITTLMAWVACKTRNLARFKLFHGLTLLLAIVFLGIKSYEYRDKFHHYEVQLADGRVADGHMIENDPKADHIVLHGSYFKNHAELMERHPDEKEAELTIPRADIKHMENYGPWHNTFLAIYFTLTGLHALHIIGGILVIGYLWGPGSKMWYTNPEQFTNRIEVSGLFWHFVDLVWIFLFPVLYLM
ncbi:MAG TPA: cytochrome c oxidase subunit 3 [Dongiaceae bacterium]|nr:cytochrome c oxidase subunit 3 [Dongiaceae bacterium]